MAAPVVSASSSGASCCCVPDNCGTFLVDAYTDRTRMELQYGKNNIQQWANIDNGDVTEQATLDFIEQRISAKAVEATAYIDDRLRCKGYNVPFCVVPQTIQQIAAKLAGYLLYEARGITDADPDNNELKPQLDFVNKTLRELTADKLRLGNAQRKNYPMSVDFLTDDFPSAISCEPFEGLILRAGDAWGLLIQLYWNCETFDITTSSTVEVSIVDFTRTIVLAGPLTAISSSINADWSTSLIDITFSGPATSSIPPGNAYVKTVVTGTMTDSESNIIASPQTFYLPLWVVSA